VYSFLSQLIITDRVVPLVLLFFSVLKLLVRKND
jgi:hypothetical protein